MRSIVQMAQEAECPQNVESGVRAVWNGLRNNKLKLFGRVLEVLYVSNNARYNNLSTDRKFRTRRESRRAEVVRYNRLQSFPRPFV